MKSVLALLFPCVSKYKLTFVSFLHYADFLAYYKHIYSQLLNWILYLLLFYASQEYHHQIASGAHSTFPCKKVNCARSRTRKGGRSTGSKYWFFRKGPCSSRSLHWQTHPAYQSWLSPNPALQVNRREFAHFRIKLHPHSFPPFTCLTLFLIKKPNPFVLSAAQSAVLTQQMNKYQCSTRLNRSLLWQLLLR